MGKTSKKFRTIALVMILVLTFLLMPFSFSHWLMPLQGSTASDYTRFMLGYIGEEGDDPYSRLKDIDTPQDIIDALKKIENDLSAYEFEMMVEALESFVSSLTSYNQYEENIYLAKSASDLFEGGETEVGRNDVLIFLTIDPETKRPEVLLVHILPDFSFAGSDTISDEDTLWRALSASYSNIYGHYVSNVFMQGNRYTRRHAPVEIHEKFYLFLGNGWGDYSPETGGEWRMVLDEYYTHDPFNRSYFAGSIVRWNDGNYYIADQTTWNAAPSWGWTQIPFFTDGFTANSGRVVYTLDAGGKPHFWRAVANNVSQSPSPETARQNLWHELDNRWGWVGDHPNTSTIRSHYVAHNNYNQNDVIIYGSSPSFRYRYYRAVKDVPSDESPLIYSQGNIPQLNSEFWESIYSYDN